MDVKLTVVEKREHWARDQRTEGLKLKDQCMLRSGDACLVFLWKQKSTL